ncbi:putative immunoglobulin-blocking virulence protein, partial [Mycoplasmopsis bovis]
MSMLKTRKNRILVFSLLSGGVLSIASAVAIYKATSDFNFAQSLFSYETYDSQLANSKNVKPAYDSIRDKNVIEKQVEPIKIEEPKPKPEPIIIKTPKADESSSAELPKESPKVIESNPIVHSPNTQRRQITLNGVQVY